MFLRAVSRHETQNSTVDSRWVWWKITLVGEAMLMDNALSHITAANAEHPINVSFHLWGF